MRDRNRWIRCTMCRCRRPHSGHTSLPRSSDGSRCHRSRRNACRPGADRAPVRRSNHNSCSWGTPRMRVHKMRVWCTQRRWPLPRQAGQLENDIPFLGHKRLVAGLVRRSSRNKMAIQLAAPRHKRIQFRSWRPRMTCSSSLCSSMSELCSCRVRFFSRHLNRYATGVLPTCRYRAVRGGLTGRLLPAGLQLYQCVPT